MSLRFAPEQLAGFCLDAKRLVEQAEDQQDRPLAVLAMEDVNVASRSSARLLITATHPL